MIKKLLKKCIMEIIKEFKDGRITCEKITSVSANDILRLLENDEIATFQVVKLEEKKEKFNVTKNVTLKNRVPSFRLKDHLENKKKEQQERDFVKTTRKERCAERNFSLSERNMITLSGCSLNAQRIFWHIYDSKTPITREILCEIFRIVPMTASRAIKELTNNHLIVRCGSKKTGYYEISENVRVSKENNDGTNNIQTIQKGISQD